MQKILFILLVGCCWGSLFSQGKYSNIDRSYHIEVELDSDTVAFSYVLEFYKTDSTSFANYTTTSLDTFLYLMQEDIELQPQSKNDLLFYIHGYMGGQQMNLHYTKKDLIKRYLNPEESDIARLISIRWPGNNPIYQVDKQNILKVGPTLSAMMTNLISKVHNIDNGEEIDFHIINHSMGCQLFKELSLHFPSNDRKYFDQVLLCAPDLDTDVFVEGGPFVDHGRYSNRTTVYFSNKDFTLGMSRQLNKKDRLGLDGPVEESIISSTLDFIEMSHVMDEKMLPMRMAGHSYYRGSDIGGYDILQTLLGKKAASVRHRVPNKDRKRFYKVIVPEQN